MGERVRMPAHKSEDVTWIAKREFPATRKELPLFMTMDETINS